MNTIVFIVVMWSIIGIIIFGCFIGHFDCDELPEFFSRLRSSFSKLQLGLIYLSFGPLFYIGWLTVSTVRNVWWLLGRW